MTQSVSIGVLSFNHPDLTARCLTSVLRHADPSLITLLHNGSRPEVEVRLRKEFSNIQHATLPQNRGFSGGANALLNEIFKNASASWALLITNDCELLEINRAPSSCGLYAPTIFRRNTGRIDSVGGQFRPLTGHLRHLRQQTPTIAESVGRAFFGDYFYVPGTAFYIDRESWATLKGFDESLHTYWEDVDLSVRAQKLAITVGTWPSTILKHGVGKTCHKDPFYTNHLFRRNRQIVSEKHTPTWQRFLRPFFDLTPPS
jgi:GT2 family glycosyltransferase